MTEAQKYAIPIAHPELRSMLPSMSRSSFSGYLEEAFEAGAAWQRERFVAWLKEQDDTGFGGTMSGEWLAEQFAKAFDADAKKTEGT